MRQVVRSEGEPRDGKCIGGMTSTPILKTMATQPGMPSQVIGSDEACRRDHIPHLTDQEVLFDGRLSDGEFVLDGRSKKEQTRPFSGVINQNKALYVLGTEHDDKIYLDAGNDTVFAGYGDDEIWVGFGTNTITTNVGHDKVHIGTNAWEQDKSVNTEHTRVTDFALGEDKIILDGVSSRDSILSMQAYGNTELIDILDDFNRHHMLTLVMTGPNNVQEYDRQSLITEVFEFNAV